MVAAMTSGSRPRPIRPACPLGRKARLRIPANAAKAPGAQPAGAPGRPSLDYDRFVNCRRKQRGGCLAPSARACPRPPTEAAGQALPYSAQLVRNVNSLFGCPSWMLIEPCASLQVLISCGFLREFSPFGWLPNCSVAAQQTAGVDVKLPSPVSRMDVAVGRRAGVEGSPREGPESAQKPPPIARGRAVSPPFRDLPCPVERRRHPAFCGRLTSGARP